MEFHPFPRLPLELREEIWRYCLPNRVRELDGCANFLVFTYDGPWPCRLSDTIIKNTRPPLIARVCYESRSVAFKTGRVSSQEDLPPEYDWSCQTLIPKAWQDRTRDSFHLNWTTEYEVDCVAGGSPLHCIAWEGSRTAGSGSLMVKYLDPYYGDPYWEDIYDHIDPRHAPSAPVAFSSDKLRDLDALKQLSRWLVVMQLIVVHCDPKTPATANLFGLLGDAPVQIIDVAEVARIDAYFRLAETCESQASVTIRQDFTRQPANLTKQRLGALIMRQFGDTDLAAAMHPAIMFRLCTQSCNHVGPRSWPR